MDLNQKILAAILAAFFLIALIRVFQTPLRLALKLLANTLLGFLALWVVNLTAGRHGDHPGAEPAQRPGHRHSRPAGFCSAPSDPMGAIEYI